MTDCDAVDDYLSGLSEEKRRCLLDLRAELRRHVPDAQDVMSYGMPGLRRGKMVAGYAAFKAHCGLYPHSGTIIPQLAAELESLGLKHSKSGVLFAPDTRLPSALVGQIVALRLAEIAA